MCKCVHIICVCVCVWICVWNIWMCVCVNVCISFVCLNCVCKYVHEICKCVRVYVFVCKCVHIISVCVFMHVSVYVRKMFSSGVCVFMCVCKCVHIICVCSGCVLMFVCLIWLNVYVCLRKSQNSHVECECVCSLQVSMFVCACVGMFVRTCGVCECIQVVVCVFGLNAAIPRPLILYLWPTTHHHWSSIESSHRGGTPEEKQYRRLASGPFTSPAGPPEAGGRVTASLNCTNEPVIDEPLSLWPYNERRAWEHSDGEKVAETKKLKFMGNIC